MALTDLLWACPACGRDHGLRPAGKKAFVCHGCGTRFTRGRGAEVVAVGADGSERAAVAAEWVDRLPAVESLLEGAGVATSVRPRGPQPPGVSRHALEPTASDPIRTARVQARFAEGTERVTAGGRFLNSIERFGNPSEGTLEIGPTGLSYRPDGAAPVRWDFGRLTAVQASSKTLQIKARRQPLVSFRFLDDAIFLWEGLLTHAVRAYYRREGHGEVAEFQPRICVRG